MVARRTRDVAERRHARLRRTCSPRRAARRCCRGGRDPCLRPGSRPASPCGTARTRVYALPGVPSELRAMWSWVRGELAAAGVLADAVSRVVRIFGVGELQVGAVLDAAPRTLVDVAINVGGGEVAVRLRHERTAEAQAEADALVAALERGRPGLLRRRPHHRRAPRRRAALRAARRSPSPSRAPAACSAGASRRCRAAPTTSSAA